MTKLDYVSDVLMQSCHYTDLYADRHFMTTFSGCEEFNDWNIVETHYVYMLLEPKTLKPFYIGRSNDLNRRMSNHRNGKSGNPDLNNYIAGLEGRIHFEYSILGEINAPEIYAKKLEFMWIVTAGLFFDLQNKNHSGFIGEIAYSLEDFKWLYECVNKKTDYASYVDQSIRMFYLRNNIELSRPTKGI